MIPKFHVPENMCMQEPKLLEPLVAHRTRESLWLPHCVHSRTSPPSTLALPHGMLNMCLCSRSRRIDRMANGALVHDHAHSLHTVLSMSPHNALHLVGPNPVAPKAYFFRWDFHLYFLEVEKSASGDDHRERHLLSLA